MEVLELAPPPPPKILTPQQLAEERKDEQYLRHLLKVRLMPVIEMMKQKYKRLKKPFVGEERLQVLFPPTPPEDVVGSDIPQPPQGDVAIVFDEHQEPMVHDLVKDKKFYNLDLEMIEERIFNGYYITPRQFVTDIRHLAADCQTSGERNAMLQGSELLTNAEIAIVDMENENPVLFQLWNQAMEKSTERRRKRAEEKRKTVELSATRATTAGQSIPWPPQFQDQNSLDPGQQGSMAAPITPLQAQMNRRMEPLIEERSVTSNGYNASSEAGNQTGSKSNDSDGDHVMSDISLHNHAGNDQSPVSQINVQVHTTQTMERFTYTQGQGPDTIPYSIHRQSESQNVTQKSGGTQNFSSVGVTSTQKQFDLYTNDASTTTSGKKTDGYTQSNATNSGSRVATHPEINQDSHPVPPLNLFSESVRRNQDPDLAFGSPAIGDSQLTDTQRKLSYSLGKQCPRILILRIGIVSSGEGSTQSQHPFLASQLRNSQTKQPYSSSQPNSHSSQHSVQASPTIPLSRRQQANHQATPGPPSLPRPPDPPLLLDHNTLKAFHRDLVNKTNDFTIEQLEQVNAAIMDLIWKHRNSWDRNDIIVDAEFALKEVLEDIHEMDQFSQRTVGRILGEEAAPKYPNILDDSNFSNNA